MRAPSDIKITSFKAFMILQELLSAVSMIPGVLLAIYWLSQPECGIIFPIGYMGCCLASIAHHLYAASFRYSTTLLRIDIASQQLCAIIFLGIERQYLRMSLCILLALFSNTMSLDSPKPNMGAGIPKRFLVFAINATMLLVVIELYGLMTKVLFIIALACFCYTPALFHLIIHCIIYNISAKYCLIPFR